jgi:hypothetical protein
MIKHPEKAGILIYLKNIFRFIRPYLWLVSLVILPNLFAARTDVIILANGDKITGEIKTMDMGTLTYKTDDMSTIQIDWSKVRSIRSVNTFEIKLTNGMIYYASPDTASKPGKVAIVTQFEPEYVAIEVNLYEIVSIIRIKNIIWSRFNGKYSLGIGLKKADKTSTFNFNASTTYRSRKLLSQLSLVSNRSRVDTGRINSNQNFDFYMYRSFKTDWYAGGVVSFQQNTELGLDLRGLFAAEVGNFAIKNNLHELMIGGGLQATREWTNDGQVNNYIEGKLSVYYKIFKFQHPKIDVTSNFVVYPGLSNWGRVRTEFNADASLELFKDFFLGFNIYHKFDNRPAEGASKSDWGLNTTLGYSF